MNIGGVDIDSIDLDNSDFVLPDVVQGRWLNADADIYAYNCAGNDDTTHEEVVFNIKSMVAGRMQAGGATQYILQFTGDGSDKGKRHEVACLKKYQIGREDKPKPKNLAFVRQYIKTNMQSCGHWDQEADDGLAQFQQKFIDAGEIHLCVLDSSDKDLRMVAGLHLDPDTDKIIEVKGFGSCWYDSGKSKTTGWGTSFFWHQLLMGDGADDIPGLPAFGRRLSYTRWPTAPLKEQLRRVSQCTMPSGKQLNSKQQRAAEDKMYELRANFKCKSVGAVGAYEYLLGVDNDKAAYDLVLAAYESHYGTEEFQFTDWRDNTYTRTAKQMMLEQAVLLWMRRKNSITDVLDFFNEVNNDKTSS
jgi:hypothetical protein